MRLGVLFPYFGPDGKLWTGEDTAKVAHDVEEAGIDGLWLADRLPEVGRADLDRPEPMMYLSLITQATRDIELGTCIFSMPVRDPYDCAWRFSTLETLAPGRITLGLGTSSQPNEYERVGLDWDDRYQRMADHRKMLSTLLAGHREDETPDPDAIQTSIMRSGLPRLVLGSWGSETQLKRAANHYDGWMGSAGPGARRYGWKHALDESIQLFRSLGGKRAIMSTVSLDLDAETTELSRDSFHCRCDPKTARERLKHIEELGFDDVILWSRQQRAAEGEEFALSPRRLEQIRALVNKDTTDYRRV